MRCHSCLLRGPWALSGGLYPQCPGCGAAAPSAKGPAPHDSTERQSPRRRMVPARRVLTRTVRIEVCRAS